MLALLLYLKRDYVESMQVLRQYWEEGGGDESVFWLIFALVELAQGNPASATMDLDSSLKSAVRYRVLLLDGDENLARETLPLLGLSAVAKAQAGDLKGAKERMADLSKHRPWNDLQRALGFMALGRQNEAVTSLWQAFKKRNTLINWLHLIPLFDPLRDHPRFQELVRVVSKASSA
jgi:hypothetical protein